MACGPRAIIFGVTAGSGVRRFSVFAAIASAALLCGDQAVAQEREVFLFVVNATPKAAAQGALDVLWIPEPVLKYCLGKTREQCVAIDYCIRTTNRNVSQCRTLPVDISKISKYSRDVYPSRVLGITYFRAASGGIDGLNALFEHYERSPKTGFDQVSLKARFKARIRVKRSADDDDFDLLQVLSTPE
jgi:hypothetical protein